MADITKPNVESLFAAPNYATVGASVGAGVQAPAIDILMGDFQDMESSKSELGGLASDLLYAAGHPRERLANMAQGVVAGIAGFQRMRADELERLGEDGIYGEDYAKEVRQSAENLSRQAKDIKTDLDKKYKMQSATGEFLKGLEGSAPATLAGVATSLIAGPVAGFIVGAGLGAGQVGGQKYDERIDMGDSPEQALNAFLIHGTTELVFEMAPLPFFNKLFKAAKAGKPILGKAVREMFAEGIQETATGIVQGAEDSWRGQGKDPAGLAGLREYVTSGQIAKDALQNFAGGVLMSGAINTTVMKPIQMSYKPKAVEAVKQMDQAIKAAEAQGSSTIDIGGVATPIDEVRENLETTVENFGIKPEEWIAPEMGKANQDQRIFDSAVLGIRESLAPKVETPTQTVEATPNDVEAEQVEAATQVEDSPQVAAVEQPISVPAEGRAIHQAGSVKAFGQVPSAFAETLNDIYKGLDWQPAVELYSTSDLLPADLENLQKSSEEIATIGSAKIFSQISPEGSRIYRIVGKFGSRNKLWELSTVMHEALGHMTDYEFYQSAPDAIKQTVDKRFEEWLATKDAPSFISEDIIEQVADPSKAMSQITAERAGETEAQWKARMFREFKAHQISRAMQKRPEVRSVIERHWAKLYAKLQELYKSFKENYLDIATNVGTMDEFVDWLYLSRASQPTQEDTKGSVENFNTKLNPFVEAVYNSLFEMVNGKRQIKQAWKVKRIYKDGKSGSISRGDLERSGYSYKEDSKLRLTRVMHGSDSTLFKIPWDIERGINRDQARMIAVNIRDLLVATTLKTPQALKRPKVPAGYKALMRIIDSRAKAMAAEEGISEKQAKLNILSGQGSAFSKLTPGIVGTPRFTDNQADRTLRPLQRDIERFQTEYPGLFKELYGELTSAEEVQAEEPVQSVLEDIHSEVEEPVKANTELDAIAENVEALVDAWYNKPRPSERVRDFDKMVEKVIFYFDHKGKDYTEVSADIRNFVNATIKDKFQELSGLEIQKDIKNKSTAIDKVIQLHNAGMDTTMEEIELRQIAKDMGMLEDDFVISLERYLQGEGNLTKLGQFTDSVDGKTKVVIPSSRGRWKSHGDPGSGLLPKSVKSNLVGGAIELGNIWNDPELYKAYPELSNLKVVFYKDEKTNDLGSSNWVDSTIYINYAASTEKVKDTLVHEIQHQIQGIENFAGGSSPEQMNALKGEVKESLEDTLGLLGAAKRIQKDLTKRTAEESRDHSYKTLEGKALELAEGVYLRLAGDSIDGVIETLEDELDQARSDWSKIAGSSGMELYLNTAGEIEARVAAKFRKLTDEVIKDVLDNLGPDGLQDVHFTGRKIRTNARSGVVHLSVLSTTKDYANDELLYASYEALKGDDLAVRPIKNAKKIRLKSRSTRKEGPYAEVLKENLKPRKVRVRKSASMKQIEDRQRRDAEFVAKMDVIKDRSERTGKSISEVMLSAGFSAPETRKAVAKYYRLQSKFTQNEMILRLAEVAGLINEDTGREGLVGLTKMLFPPVGDEPGSDGTLQSLTPLSKDMLINQLQMIILSKQGSKFDIESEQTLAELKDEFQKEYDNLSGFKKVWSLISWIQSSSADFLDLSEAGKKLRFQLRKYLLEKTLMQRDFLVKLNEYGSLYTTEEERFHLYELLQGDATPKNQKEKDFVSMIHTVNVLYSKESASLGVKIYKKDGTFKYFKHSKEVALQYFPHMWKPEWFRKPTDNMIQSLLDSGEAIDRAHAKILISKMGKDRVRMSKFANIEMERETNLEGWITDPIEVYTKYIQETTRRLAAIKIFGENPEINLAQFAIRHFKDSRDPDSFTKARDLINRVLGNRVDDALLKEPKAGLSTGVMLSVGLMLQHAMLVQPGVLANMGGMGGYRNLVKGIIKVLPSLWGNQDSKNSVRWAQLAGVHAFTVSRELNDIVMEDQQRLKTDKILRAFGITQVDGFLRIISAIVGKLYATDVALRYAESQDPKDARRLKDLGIDPRKITQEYLQTTDWFAHDLRLAALAFTEDTNFVIDPLRSPSLVQKHPLLQPFMLFKNFAFQQHRMLLKMLKDKEFGKFIGTLLGSVTGGAVINLFRMLIKWEDPEKVLESDGIAKTVWRSFVAGGGPGLFAEAFGNAATMSGGRLTGGGSLSVDSPMLGLIEQGLKGAGSFYDLAIGDADQNDANQLFKTGAMLMQGLILSKAPMHVGVPLTAGIGIARPAVERLMAPSERQENVSVFR